MADALGIDWAIWGVALLTLASGGAVALTMRERLHSPAGSGMVAASGPVGFAAPEAAEGGRIADGRQPG
jgi:hypothetical protein